VALWDPSVGSGPNSAGSVWPAGNNGHASLRDAWKQTNKQTNKAKKGQQVEDEVVTFDLSSAAVHFTENCSVKFPSNCKVDVDDFHATSLGNVTEIATICTESGIWQPIAFNCVFDPLAVNLKCKKYSIGLL
jgi:hypothetical protein